MKPANHDGNHRREDGKEWPEGENWQDLTAEYFQSLGVISGSELQGEWTPRAE